VPQISLEEFFAQNPGPCGDKLVPIETAADLGAPAVFA
jgi:hypothetical protein